MSEEKNHTEAVRWMGTARGDLATARVLLYNERYAHSCFHAQQAAEKAMKSLWSSLDRDPWGHAVRNDLFHPSSHSILSCRSSVRVLPAWHAGVQHEDRRGARQDSVAAHLGAVGGVSARHRGASTERPGGSRDRRQAVGAQDEASAGVSERTSDGKAAFYADVLIVFEPGRAVVCEDLARCDRPRRIQFGGRSEEKTDAIHPGIQQESAGREVTLR